MRLSGRVAIITGAAQGLGFAYAKRLVQEGARVVIADLVDCHKKVLAWPAELQANALFHQTDVQATAEIERLLETTIREYGRVDVLINNAAIFSGLVRRPFYELSGEEWQRVLAVNVVGAFQCIRAVFPHMKNQGYGKIINISSDAALKGLPNLLHYVTSKGAIMTMTRALARELGPHNITINAIAPGYTYHEDNLRWNEERNETVMSLRCLQRTQRPDDLLGTVVFLASSESDFITGQTIVVDGGEVFH